jgi:hypothetical protein
MEKIYYLPQKYVDLGFELSKVGDKSLTLRRQDNLIFFFVSGIDARGDFVKRLCECHLKLGAKEKLMSRN